VPSSHGGSRRFESYSAHHGAAAVCFRGEVLRPLPRPQDFACGLTPAKRLKFESSSAHQRANGLAGFALCLSSSCAEGRLGEPFVLHPHIESWAACFRKEPDQPRCQLSPSLLQKLIGDCGVQANSQHSLQVQCRGIHLKVSRVEYATGPVSNVVDSLMSAGKNLRSG
jgi:hypothetical protein